VSAGPRISLEQALAASAILGQAWGFGEDCHLVGSVRRRRATVGDLEFLAPARPGLPGTRDPLCERIQETMEAESVFNVTQAATVGRALKGLRPGFLAANLVVNVLPGIALPVQIYRYTPDNLGWMLIERTGPREFGMWFLGKWKARFGIPFGDAGRASIDGHLVDKTGQVVKVATEAEAFDLAAISSIAPEKRDEFAERLAARKAGAR
jgi:DNA polymerase/3'-5' exonuclease PolX